MVGWNCSSPEKLFRRLGRDGGSVALGLEAAIHAAKRFQALADVVQLKFQSNADGDGGCGVQSVMCARNIQAKLTQVLRAKDHAKAAEEHPGPRRRRRRRDN